MTMKPIQSYRILQAVAGSAVLGGLFVVSRYNYLLFHGLVELFAVAVAWSVFFLVWSTRRLMRNDALLLLGIAYFFVGFIDLVHTLGYKGMGIFADSSASGHATRLWIAARGVETVSLVLFPLLLGRRIRAWPVLWAYAGVTALLMATIFAWDLFPDCYIEGAGLTGFKVGAEYAICLMLALAIGLLFKRRERLDATVLHPMIGAMAATIAGELAFTLYTDVYGLSNMTGHLLKVVSFFLVCLALVRASATRPFATLLRDFQREKEKLQEAEETYRSIFLNSQIGLFRTDMRTGELLDANDTVARFIGCQSREELLAEPFDIAERYVDPEDRRKMVSMLESDGEFQNFEARFRRNDGSVLWMRYSARLVPEKGWVEGVSEDVTERKRMEAQLRRAAARYRRLEENVPAVIYQFLMTPDGQFAFPYISEAVERMAGVPPAAVVRDASSILDMIPPHERDAFRQGVLESAKTLAPYRAVLRIVKDGRDLWFQCRSTPERQSDGSVLWDGVIVDVTKEHESQRQLRLQAMVLDQISDRVTVTDLKGVITYVNEAEARSLGYGREDLVGASVEKYGDDPERGATQREILERTLQEGHWRGEVVNFAADGREVVMDCRTHVVRDADGTPIALAGIATDITERKKAEDALRKKEDQLTEAMKMARAGHWEYDVADDAFTFNDNFYRIFGTTAEEVGGYRMSSADYARRFCHPDDAHVVAEETRAAIRATDPRHSRRIEHRMLYSNGEIGHVVVRFFIVKDARGRTVKTYGVNQDITERKRAEEKVRLTLERRQREAEALAAVALSGHLSRGEVPELARELTEAAARALEVERAGVWLFDKEQTELVNVDNYALSTGEHSSGAVLREREYRSEFDALKEAKYVAAADPLTDPRTAGYAEGYLKPNRIVAVLDAVIRRGDRNLGVLCFEHVDRGHRWEEDEIAFACQLADQVALALSNREYRRVREEKSRIEEQYRQAQKVESIGRLAGGVAHDLNNLLTPVLGYAEILRKDLAPEDAKSRSVDQILNAGTRARDLVRQLLAFSRKQTLELKRIDINEVLGSFGKLLRRTIREDIEIEYRLAPIPLPVMADANQVEQVVMNLAVNAADAMPNGGVLTIETARAALDEEYAQAHPGAKAGDYLLLAFRDTGFGMDGDTLENIFEPFFSTKGEQGTGLGLATVYGIVKQHNGDIEVHSEPGKGTTFKVYLPLAGESSVREKANPKPATSPKGSECVLLVEDNDQVRCLANEILLQQGYSVVSARDGHEALEASERHEGPLHLLLTDVVMPKMNGRELFGRISEAYPDIKVLYMSGYTTNVITHDGSLDEGVQFIEKPFTVKELAEKVRVVLDMD